MLIIKLAHKILIIQTYCLSFVKHQKTDKQTLIR